MKFPMPFGFPFLSFFSLPMILGSSSILNIRSLDILFCFSSSALRSSASRYMLRNLYILKTFPFFPILSWAKKTGPGDFLLMAGAMKMYRIPVKMQPKKPATMSNRRLMASDSADANLTEDVRTSK